MAHAQKPDLVFQRNGRVHLNRRGCQFSRLLAVKECGSADSNCIDRAPSSSSRLLATHSIRIFPLHFPSRASPCAIRFRTRYTLHTKIRSVEQKMNILNEIPGVGFVPTVTYLNLLNWAMSNSLLIFLNELLNINHSTILLNTN